MIRALRRAAGAALLAALAGCLTFGAEPGPPRGTYHERLHGFARLLAMEDRRAYDPLLAGRTASSPDPWLRAKTALAVGRLRDPDAAIVLPPLLIDAEPSVRRAAAFAAGLAGDTRLVPLLAGALSGADAGTAANAAEALGKLGGPEATDALLAALARREAAVPARAASALAMFRKPEARTVAALVGTLGEEPLAPELRRAVVYSLARKPDPAAVSALRAVLRREERTAAAPPAAASDEVAWAVRGLGILEDDQSAPDLVRLAASPGVSVAVQALSALHSLSKKSALTQDEKLARAAATVAIQRANDALPGIAIAALRLLGALPDAPESRAALEENLLRKGWRGQTALVSLSRLDAARAPQRAAARIDAAVVADTLEMRLGAAESLEFLAGREKGKEGISSNDPLAAALISDPAPRVRAAALSSLSKKSPETATYWLLAGLVDRDPSVRDVALEAAATILDKGSADLTRAWASAFERAFESGEPDFAVGALEAAAARGEAGRGLVASHASDADAVARAKARRLLVETYGASPASFRPVPVRTRLSPSDYDRLARAANESLFSATVETARGTAVLDLDAEEAPVTVESFRALAAKHFFDGLVVHRVVPDFVVQTGDPRGDGSGGPGYAIRDEINALRYERGAIGMALSGPDTGGSQWFVTLAEEIHLDGGYTVFGRVARGMDLFDQTGQDDRLVSVRVTERARPARPPGAPE